MKPLFASRFLVICSRLWKMSRQREFSPGRVHTLGTDQYETGIVVSGRSQIESHGFSLLPTLKSIPSVQPIVTNLNFICCRFFERITRSLSLRFLVRSRAV